ncbi:hypothetical protein JCM21714_4311 [Gracilibacillus boraciitolerans JCM 21714]|uniref:DUF6449 domain-containing protein n=1 Tax=Gracilibacillus boraciitolerans JCM 21714 TaxID=1298598 RepID=W4VPH1_9BACI|nr:hypothetical protein [Gracilibacillus boraciitolerans]GAE95102.1 hypothetical protein JCM21714_4311 [Gracilibacillus boraciitolerans JCM 21714]
MYIEESVELFFTYYLENGQKMSRNYFIPSNEKIKEWLRPILNSESYKRSQVKWLYDDISKFSLITLYGNQEHKVITNQSTMIQIIDALKKDYLSASYDEINRSYYQEFASMEF